MNPIEANWDDPTEATGAIEARLRQLDAGTLQRLNESLSFRIDHMVRRIEYAESRRQTIATLAGGLIAAGIALFALLLDAPAGPIRTALGVLAAAILSSATLTLVAWFRQTNPPYGFIRIDTSRRPWKWFYRDALSKHEEFKFDWWKSKNSDTNKQPGAVFERQWGSFAQRELDLADLVTDVLQNLQQVYLLHVNEKYKNLFLSQLKTVLLRGVIASTLAFFVALGVAYLADDDAQSAPSPIPTSTATSTPDP